MVQVVSQNDLSSNQILAKCSCDHHHHFGYITKLTKENIIKETVEKVMIILRRKIIFLNQNI
jgi:hypothetical protein